ncbi:hypothetical protein LR013_04410, partial [candidate division NPL-UPA2 bacterium]|nr:hypothetical protein [candidate division NPL-UPA2 bacterium]
NEEKIVRGKKGVSGKLKELSKKGKLKPSQIYRQLEDLPLEALLLFRARAGKIARERVAFYLSKLRQVRPKMSGNDLQKLGLKPGPQFATILKRLLYARLDGQIRTKGDEIEYVRKHFAIRAKQD